MNFLDISYSTQSRLTGTIILGVILTLTILNNAKLERIGLSSNNLR